MAKTYTLTRDYIISSLTVLNTWTPDAISATLDENRLHIVLVMEHKIAVTSGPAAIVFTSKLKLYDKCHMFIQKRKRNMFVEVIRSGQSCVFLSWNSNTMSSALIGDQFSAFLEKATSCTAIWKKDAKEKWQWLWWENLLTRKVTAKKTTQN